MMIIWTIRVAARQDSKKSAKTKNWLATMLAGPANVSAINLLWIKNIFGNDW